MTAVYCHQGGGPQRDSRVHWMNHLFVATSPSSSVYDVLAAYTHSIHILPNSSTLSTPFTILVLIILSIKKLMVRQRGRV